MRPVGREPLPDKAGESTLLSRSGGEKGLRGGGTPDLQDAAFAGTQSGVALEYKLWGIEQARAAKEQGFSGGLYHIVGLFYQALTLLGTPVSGICTAQFYKNLPQDVTRVCENLQLLGDTVSNRTKLELLPFVKDAEAELQRKHLEKGA